MHSPQKHVDSNRLNGMGGKVEHGEHFLDAAVRETHEEIGIQIPKENFSFLGIDHLYQGRGVDWVCAFFIAPILGKRFADVHIPAIDGELIWMTAQEFESSRHDPVDDLRFIWRYILQKKKFIFSLSYVPDQKAISFHIDKVTL
jgi:8-oxo-dGTP pyrophosphatase MutT (NUDIX family)